MLSCKLQKTSKTTNRTKIGPQHLEHSYDPYGLPFWDNNSWRKEAKNVERSEDQEKASKDVGINSLCIWAKFPEIVFPWSFSLDFLHLSFENLIKNLLGLWMGKFRGLPDNGQHEKWVLPDSVWIQIGKELEELTKTIPSN
jgi:hypothetical protein